MLCSLGDKTLSAVSCSAVSFISVVLSAVGSGTDAGSAPATTAAAATVAGADCVRAAMTGNAVRPVGEGGSGGS